MNLKMSGENMRDKKNSVWMLLGSILGPARDDAGTTANRGKDDGRWHPGDMDPLVEAQKKLAPSILPFS